MVRHVKLTRVIILDHSKYVVKKKTANIYTKKLKIFEIIRGGEKNSS